MTPRTATAAAGARKKAATQPPRRRDQQLPHLCASFGGHGRGLPRLGRHPLVEGATYSSSSVQLGQMAALTSSLGGTPRSVPRDGPSIGVDDEELITS
ncbi:MAG: hypothetical protein JWR58_1504 [Pseudonocardia sp.]|nr:hypothetical protein [Pseudonocardia sp.]